MKRFFLYLRYWSLIGQAKRLAVPTQNQPHSWAHQHWQNVIEETHLVEEQLFPKQKEQEVREAVQEVCQEINDEEC